MRILTTLLCIFLLLWPSQMSAASDAGERAPGTLGVQLGIPNNGLEKALMHAVVGCLAAKVRAESCEAGASAAALHALLAPLVNSFYDMNDPTLSLQEREQRREQQLRLQSLIGGLAAAIVGGDADDVGFGAQVAASGHQHNYLSHTEAVRRAQALDAIWDCHASEECSAEEIAELVATIQSLNELDMQRDAALDEACRDLHSAACALEMANLRAAFQSYTAAHQNGQLLADGSFTEYAHGVASLYAQYQAEMLQNAFFNALIQMPVDSVTGAVDLVTIIAQATLGDQTARDQLTLLTDSIWATITDPVGAVEQGFEDIAARLEEAERLEAAGDWQGAAQIIGEVSAGFTYAAAGVVSGGVGVGAQVLRWIPSPGRGLPSGFTTDADGRIYDNDGYEVAITGTGDTAGWTRISDEPVVDANMGRPPVTNPTAQQVATANDLGVDARWVRADGSIDWPPNNGFAGAPEVVNLQLGARIDRYGSNNGGFLSPAGTPFEQRALPNSSANSQFQTFEVVMPLPVNSGQAAPWFGQPGGGTQYQLQGVNVQQLLDEGYLRVVN